MPTDPIVKYPFANSALRLLAMMTIGAGTAFANGSINNNPSLEFRSDTIECEEILLKGIQHLHNNHDYHESAFGCLESSNTSKNGIGGLIFDLENIPANLQQALERRQKKGGNGQGSERGKKMRLTMNNTLKDQGRIILTEST